MKQNQVVFNLASKLLQYPSADLWDYMDDILLELEAIEDELIKENFIKFLQFVEQSSYADLCQHYCLTFDFNERTTLFLTYSVFKDNRDRGPALVKLRQEFLAAGVELASDELPDYLPLILEFASIASVEKAEKILFLHLRAMERLCLELEGANSPYHLLLKVCVETVKRMKLTQSLRNPDERRII